jgi:DNA modification methylase
MKTNVLYYGDNLHILREYIHDESVDLIYLDPPFNSNRSYNVLFKEETGASSPAQIEAFEDTWNWAGAAAAYDEIAHSPNQSVARIVRALVEGLGHNQVTAYLTMMGVRLVELHRVLKPTGSIYLHCDPTAGPYLRVIMDAVFGPKNFRNEISWRRSFSHNDPNRYGANYDTIHFYSKSKTRTWNPQYTSHRREYLDRDYRFAEGPDGQIITLKKGQDPPPGWRRFRQDNLTANKPGGDVEYEWKGVKPYRGRYWAYSKENMALFERQGRLLYRATGMPVYKRYLDEMPGVPLQAFWDDVSHIISGSKETLGYPTQKPVALLERIIRASSNTGDVVLDPFCGCGTAVHAAQKLGRQWIGIDITHLAIGLIRRRMQDAFPTLQIDVIGEPVDLPGAQDLARRDKHQFQWWALDQVQAIPIAGKKKGADKGIDGVIPFLAERPDKYKRAIVSVKGGEKVSVTAVRDLVGVLQRENEPIGIIITLVKPTRDMATEAASAGFYENELWGKSYARIQLLTIEDILNGKRPDIPPSMGASPFAKAQVEQEQATTERLL